MSLKDRKFTVRLGAQTCAVRYVRGMTSRTLLEDARRMFGIPASEPYYLCEAGGSSVDDDQRAESLDDVLLMTPGYRLAPESRVPPGSRVQQRGHQSHLSNMSSRLSTPPQSPLLGAANAHLRPGAVMHNRAPSRLVVAAARSSLGAPSEPLGTSAGGQVLIDGAPKSAPSMSSPLSVASPDHNAVTNLDTSVPEMPHASATLIPVTRSTALAIFLAVYEASPRLPLRLWHVLGRLSLALAATAPASMPRPLLHMPMVPARVAIELLTRSALAGTRRLLRDVQSASVTPLALAAISLKTITSLLVDVCVGKAAGEQNMWLDLADISAAMISIANMLCTVTDEPALDDSQRTSRLQHATQVLMQECASSAAVLIGSPSAAAVPPPRGLQSCHPHRLIDWLTVTARTGPMTPDARPPMDISRTDARCVADWCTTVLFQTQGLQVCGCEQVHDRRSLPHTIPRADRPRGTCQRLCFDAGESTRAVISPPNDSCSGSCCYEAHSTASSRVACCISFGGRRRADGCQYGEQEN